VQVGGDSFPLGAKQAVTPGFMGEDGDDLRVQRSPAGGVCLRVPLIYKTSKLPIGFLTVVLANTSPVFSEMLSS
jgi:hypothetical protein